MACVSRPLQTAPANEGLNFSDEWLESPKSNPVSPYQWTVGTPAEFLWFTTDSLFPESIAHPFLLPIEYATASNERPGDANVGYFGFPNLKDHQQRPEATTKETHSSEFPHLLYPTHSLELLRSSGRPTHLGWGSDVNFGPEKGYKPAASKLTVDSMHQDQMEFMSMMYEERKPSSVPASSPPPPPPRRTEARRNSFPTYRFRSFQQKDMQRDSLDGPPLKRWKGRTTTATVSSPSCSESSNSNPKARAKQSRAKPCSTPGSAENVARRKLTSTEVKPPREHLSLKKKRENHNRCEQKRRLLIKEGFDQLCELVPGMLRRTGFNKSTMLTMTAEWLEELLEGNEALADQLAVMQKG